MGVVLAGVDTLVIGFRVTEFDLSPDEWNYLEASKLAAQSALFDGGGTPVTLRGHSFSMLAKGSHGYDYILANDDLRVQIAARATGGSSYPEVRIRFASAFLWRYGGWQAAYFYVEKWVREWALGNEEQVSQVDLCLDLSESLPDLDVKRGEAVTYARNKTDFYIEHHMKGMTDTGYRFGQGDLLCRVYDKLAEIAVSNKAWFMDLWRNNGWAGNTDVTRVEFQARRGHLKSQGIETMADLESKLPDLWQYFAWEWLSLRDAGKDSNRRRWKVKPFWKLIQAGVTHFGIAQGVRRITQQKPRLDRLGQLVRGAMISIAAIYTNTYHRETGEAVSISQAIGWLEMNTLPGLTSDPEFREGVAKRSARLAAFT